MKKNAMKKGGQEKTNDKKSTRSASITVVLSL